MKIIRAEAMGMCFGVRAALRAAGEVAQPEQVSIHGEIVHNRQVMEDLRQRGFRTIAEHEREETPDTPRVLITAHGISDARRGKLRAAGRSLIDTTCPLVRRIHETAQMLARQGWFVIVIGRPGHVEVTGITEDLEEHAVVAEPGDVRAYDAPRLGVICQSTTAPWQAELMLAEIRRQNPEREIRYEPTICQPTLERQLALHRLLEQVEALVVVGGANSNNTQALARLAEARGIPCRHVQQADQLEAEWVGRFETIGLTAGTSTPDATIDAVEQRLQEIGAARSPAMREAV